MLELQSKSLKTEVYRKAIHISSLWMPLWILVMSQKQSIVLFGCLFSGNLLLEYASYQNIAGIGVLFRKIFIKTLRKKEINPAHFVPTGSVYLLAGALAVSVCFTAKVAATAMCVVLISDSCAALIGKLFGTFKFYNGKSFEGTFSFILSAYIVIFCFFPTLSPIVICFISLVAAATEFFEEEIGIDDNFLIPLVTGLLLNLCV